MKNRILVLFLALALILSLAACGGSGSSATNPASTGSSASEQGDSGGNGELLPLTAGMLEGPAILTSVGQSADVSIVNTLFSKAGVEASLSNVLEADALDATKYKTLVLAVGGSSKGLGAAGIDENQELARVEALIKAAKDANMKILALHIGGSARRGTLSDKFIPESIKAADAAIILSEGDTDNLMRDLLVENGIPGEYIEQQIDTIEPIKTLFGK